MNLCKHKVTLIQQDLASAVATLDSGGALAKKPIEAPKNPIQLSYNN